ncbi:LTA synthase family protein [uncultured Allofournierella sp.]|uniref:LTA synthase family protein n=1 Tax=uncultured Allofournierella sp. TaxID=1940258 RepID=UPI0025ED0B28|nr:LTA synthase family protein [uncultured Fournierella sp.]
MQSVKTKPSIFDGIARRLSPLRYAMAPVVSLITLVCTEWIHRGELTMKVLTDNVLPHLPAFLLTWLLLGCIYQALARATRLHPLAVTVTGLLGCIPAAVTYFKLKLRGEPFFPWDLSQFSEATDVAGKSGVELQTSMWVSALIFAALFVLACFVREPKTSVRSRLLGAGIPAVGALALVFGVFISPTVSQMVGITPDMWMQNRYYRNYGVIAGFLTNIQNLQVDKPAGYSQEAVQEIIDKDASRDLAPEFTGSYKNEGDGAVKQPNIIFVMNESFWDVAELEEYGVEFDQEVTPNLHRLMESAAYGKAYSPSFGGGTCDVEFEALTGYSVEFLPSGCKPFQQHVTRPMFSVASYLKEQGYATQAIHCYYAKFWSRNTAYPNLGFDEFISLENFENPEKKRDYYWGGGLVTDAEMTRRIIQEWEERDQDQPLFMHAVTMQNHTSYNEANYPEEELVDIVKAPEGISDKTLGALRDFATGVKEADAMLGELTDYFSQVDEPVILVFWGDHYNPIGSGYEVYTATGYSSSQDSEAPELHQMPLMIWSNYWDEPVDIGTVGAYEISPVTFELYGLEQPALFDHLIDQLSAYRSRTHGVTIQPDGSADTEELTEEQTQWFDEHWMLQYDLMFGQEYALGGQ